MSTGTDEPVMPDLLVGLDNGLDDAGRIRREGDLDRIAPVFRPLVADVEAALRAALGDRLHSIYLYGSVPRGTAVAGRSDLDVSIVLHRPPTPEDRAMVEHVSAELDRATEVVDEVGVDVDGRDNVLSEDQRYDEAFQIAVLNTPLWGPDLADELPDQYPTAALAYGINRGLRTAFDRLADCVRLGWGRLSGRPPISEQDHLVALELLDAADRWVH